MKFFKIQEALIEKDKKYLVKIGILIFISLVIISLLYDLSILSHKTIIGIYVGLLILVSIVHISWLMISSYYLDIKKANRISNSASTKKVEDLEMKYFTLTSKINKFVFIFMGEIVFFILIAMLR